MKRVTYKTEKELEALKYIAKCYDFALTLCITLAFNQLDITTISLREEKDFKHELKHSVNNALSEADRKRAEMMQIMKSGGFFESYSDTVIDLAEKDINAFRRSLERVMEKNGVERAKLYAQVETTRCLLESCVMDFKSLGEQCKEKFGYNVSSFFEEFNVSKVAYWFSRAVDKLYKDVDESKGEIKLKTSATSRIWNRIHKKIAEGEYIGGCFAAAQKEHPEFMENEVKVKKVV